MNYELCTMHYPCVMGILNVTPDSFYAGSRKQTEYDISERTNQIISEGGSIIDVGACSTRPGSEDVSLEEEMQRLRFALPIVRHVIDSLHSSEGRVGALSVDTFRPEVARMAVEEFGADIINDVSAGQYGMFEEVARLKVPYILMSVQPTLEAMIEHFHKDVEKLRALGVEDIILDPGYGFHGCSGDTVHGSGFSTDYPILADQQRLKDEFPDLPLLVGVSRKRMVWQLLDSSPEEALNGTTVLNTLALERGADILRVHDVKEAVEITRIFSAFNKHN